LTEREVSETFWAFGHENLRVTHGTTVEFTKDKHLSRNGNCILGVNAEKSLANLSDGLKEKLQEKGTTLKVTLEVDGVSEQINAHGSPNLLLTHPSDIVIRKSSYIDDRTLAVEADKAACDLSRKLVEKLQDPKQKVKITLTVYC